MRVDGFDPSVFGEGSARYWMTVVARCARLVVVVPLGEEIFWRGFLMRYLIREDFTSFPVGAFQWKAFGIEEVCFILVHVMEDWPAALL
ncbi:MAG: type II CAAX prenyl endopeptidase Rce1 family protein, partial [Spartobacteria bacterium]